MSEEKITTEFLKSFIEDQMVPSRVPYQELAAHGCSGATTFTWKRLEKRKFLPSDGDFSFLLDLAGEIMPRDGFTILLRVRFPVFTGLEPSS